MCCTPLPEELDRILLVDDEIHLTNLWRLILEVTGRYAVCEENRGDRVLRAARKFRPHLIFLDRQLEDSDGSDIAAELRTDSELKSVPIVFITGSAFQDESALHGFSNCGALTLAKPFENSALPRLADAILARHRQATGFVA